jgi:hypothetical protein
MIKTNYFITTKSNCRDADKQQPTWGFMLLGLDQQTSAKSKAGLQFGLDQHL